jgi:hypothetical protein
MSTRPPAAAWQDRSRAAAVVRLAAEVARRAAAGERPLTRAAALDLLRSQGQVGLHSASMSLGLDNGRRWTVHDDRRPVVIVPPVTPTSEPDPGDEAP